MSTPFKRDIMKELAEACHKQGIKICWYHSIMDWHHPDYLPRREWEKDRTSENADFNRYIQYMKSQLKELLTNYGEIGVLWFDGEWETTWNRDYGHDLYKYVRNLQPNIIINNRVGAGRAGMQGLTKEGVVTNFDFSPRKQVEYFGFTYEGYIYIPHDGVYAFYTDSDDGSQLFIRDALVVDNDGLHGLHEEQGVIALSKGCHPIRVTFFEKTGGDDLRVSFKGPSLQKQAIPDDALFYKK